MCLCARGVLCVCVCGVWVWVCGGGNVAMWWLSQWWCLYRPCARRGWLLQTRRQAGWLQRASLPNTSTQAPGHPPNPSLPPPPHPPPKTKNFIFLPFNNVKLPLQALSRPFHVCNPLSQNLHDGSVSAMILLTYVVAAAHATSRDMLLELLSEMGC